MELLRVDINSKSYIKIIAFGQVARKLLETIIIPTTTSIIYLKHPSGGLNNHDLDNALR